MRAMKCSGMPGMSRSTAPGSAVAARPLVGLDAIHEGALEHLLHGQADRVLGLDCGFASAEHRTADDGRLRGAALGTKKLVDERVLGAWIGVWIDHFAARIAQRMARAWPPPTGVLG
jgi:hypothetical protein